MFRVGYAGKKNANRKVSMLTPENTLNYLKDHSTYLDAFLQGEQPAHFENLIAQTFGHIFYLPYFTQDNENTRKKYRVTWHGRTSPISKAPERQDATLYAHGFYGLIESTLTTGRTQWVREFGPGIEHYTKFTTRQELDKRDVYLLLVAPNIYKDTYRGIRQKQEEGFNFIMLEVSTLVEILETSMLAFTTRHLDLRKLFSELLRCSKDSSSLQDFSDNTIRCISTWQQDILKKEKKVFVGVKSYEAMRKIGRDVIGVSEILRELETQPRVTRYLEIINDELTALAIERSLLSGRFGVSIGRDFVEEEEYFRPVPLIEFKSRAEKIINALKKP